MRRKSKMRRPEHNHGNKKIELIRKDGEWVEKKFVYIEIGDWKGWVPQ